MTRLEPACTGCRHTCAPFSIDTTCMYVCMYGLPMGRANGILRMCPFTIRANSSFLAPRAACDVCSACRHRRNTSTHFADATAWDVSVHAYVRRVPYVRKSVSTRVGGRANIYVGRPEQHRHHNTRVPQKLSGRTCCHGHGNKYVAVGKYVRTYTRHCTVARYMYSSRYSTSDTSTNNSFDRCFAK